MVETADARADLDRLALLEDRQRIARDLHDTVIQDLIAIGMQLVAAPAGPVSGTGTAASDRILAQLDETVERLRGVVFSLGDATYSEALEPIARRIIAGARVLGHESLVMLEGALDDVPANIREELAAVLREALSNVPGMPVPAPLRSR